ncbi:hypothetical protein HAX54_048281 [Datura stramonium]|uniref:Uncharacterized protein n=1 Tax=Datura stramonium TaxID=4076 RepID=A0ABS8WLY4_DATST|nr:hypothetical protein [Datura stramonium]
MGMRWFTALQRVSSGCFTGEVRRGEGERRSSGMRLVISASGTPVELTEEDGGQLKRRGRGGCVADDGVAVVIGWKRDCGVVGPPEKRRCATDGGWRRVVEKKDSEGRWWCDASGERE